MSYSSEQRGGGQYSGRVRQNGLQAKQSSDLTAAEKRQLIVRTGQDTDSAAVARQRHFFGQSGELPTEETLPAYYPGT